MKKGDRQNIIISTLRNERGVAMLIAVFAMVLTIVIATEVSYETQVEYVSSSQQINRLKAYYAAKSGVELSLFRILLYKKAMAQFGEQLKENKSLLDMIWQFPFSWPPAGLENLNAVDKDQAQTIVKESTMDAQYLATIDGEGGKIDINDLASENEALASGVRNQILQIFANEIENNKAFKDKYENFKFDELVNNIQDWVDEDNKNLNNNGDESADYEQPEGVKNLQLPPNSPFKTLGELHMVKGMEDEFFNLLKDRITVYGTKGINVNYASEAVLKAIDPQIKDRVLAEIVKRRGNQDLGGPFRGPDDFYSFLESLNVRTENMKKAELPLLFDAEYNFRIVSSGQFGNVRREITAITFDIDNLTSRYAEMLQKVDEKKNSSTGDTQTNSPPKDDKPPEKSTVKVPKGRPNVVFWQES